MVVVRIIGFLTDQKLELELKFRHITLNFPPQLFMETATKHAASKAKTVCKAFGEQQSKVELDEDGFKIPHRAAHQIRKKLEAAEYQKVVDRVLKRELDPSDYIVNIVKVRHELSPYGLSDIEWRYYLLHLVKHDPKKSTLPQIARDLVKELETKTSEIELIIDREKNPLSTKAMKEAKLYLTKIKQDRFKIKFLVDCFPAYTAKRQREKSVSSDSATYTKRHNRRASRSASKSEDEAKTDKEHSSSKQWDRELKASLGADSHRSSSAIRQGRDHTLRRANVNAWTDDISSNDRQSFGEALSPPPAPASAEYNKANPMPDDALSQTQSALRKVHASSQDNLPEVAGNTVPPTQMYVPTTLTPPGQKAGVVATVKSNPTVLTKKKSEETQMEVDVQTPTTSSGRTPVPIAAKANDLKLPNLADEEGMRQWTHDMLCGHPGGRATEFEQWGNSYVIQLKAVLDTMAQSLRIKEEGYNNMFTEWMKATKDAKDNLAKAQAVLDNAKTEKAKHAKTVAELVKARKGNLEYKKENDFLKYKLKRSQAKLKSEVESNTNLFASVKLAHASLNPETSSETSDKDKRKFLAQAKCIEILDPVDLQGETTYLLKSLPKVVPLYGPEGIMFVKTDKPSTVAMQLRMYADSWEHLNVAELKAKQERQRTTSCESSSSQA